MIHPDTELKFINPEMGFGVFATKLLPKGTITWVQDRFDQEFTPKEVEEMSPIHRELVQTYCFRNSHGNQVLCWDNGRYVNHSFRSNCFTTPYNFEIAIRDIQPGEELTDDYGYLNISAPFRAFDEGTRRKVVYPHDILTFHKIWDRKLGKVMRFIPGTEQKLRPLMSDELWSKVVRIASGYEQAESILSCHFNNAESQPYSQNGKNGRNAKSKHLSPK